MSAWFDTTNPVFVKERKVFHDFLNDYILNQIHRERAIQERCKKKKRSKGHFAHPSKSKRKPLKFTVVSHFHSTLYGALKLSVGVRLMKM